MEPPSLQTGMKHSVFWVTRRLGVGRFATPERAAHVASQGFTHVLNVGESPSIIGANDFGFRAVMDCPVVDMALIPRQTALDCLDVLHEMLADAGSKIYVHCVAGQNRSPTVLWLYLLACGMSEADAKTLITERTLDAVPGHSLLVDDALVASVRSHGRDVLGRVPAPDVLESAY